MAGFSSILLLNNTQLCVCVWCMYNILFIHRHRLTLSSCLVKVAQLCPNIFSCSVGCLIILSMIFFTLKKLWSLIRSHLFLFCFCFHFLCFIEVKWSEVAQSCLTLFDPMDCSLQGSSVHGIFQARVLFYCFISQSQKNYCYDVKEYSIFF